MASKPVTEPTEELLLSIMFSNLKHVVMSKKLIFLLFLKVTKICVTFSENSVLKDRAF